MSNQSSSKKPKEKLDKSVLSLTKPASASKKSGNEIDDIFSGKKRKKSDQQKSDTHHNRNETGKPKLTKEKKKKKQQNEDTAPPARSRKKTEDGYNIYTEEELGISKAEAGGTPLCPFDCDCCF